MPTKPTLHIIGLGTAPEQLLDAALDDQLAAAAFNPIDIQIWAIQGVEVQAMNHIVERVREEYEEGIYVNWHVSRDGASQLVDFRNNLTELGDSRRARVLVLWDESSATRQAVQAALDGKIEVYDLSDALTRIGSLVSQDNNDKEQEQVPRSAKAQKPEKYTEDQLLDMSEPDITAVAESFGIDHESFPSWEAVIEVILSKQEASDIADAMEAKKDEPESEPEVGPTEGYTRAELEGMELDTLKEICRVNEIEVEGQRPRAAKYVEAILDFQGGEVQSQTSSDDDRDAGEGGTEAEDQSYGGADIVAVLAPLQADISILADAVVGEAGMLTQQAGMAQMMEESFQAIGDVLKTLVEAVEALAEMKTPAANGVAKAAPVKAAAAAKKTSAPAIKRITRPSA